MIQQQHDTADAAQHSPNLPHVCVVGAGYAGMSCAVSLAKGGYQVTVLERSRLTGGRARALELSGHTLDNGEHLLVGAYTELQKLMQTVGVSPEQALLRKPLQLVMAEGFALRAPRLPRPLHLAWGLLTARGLTWTQRFAAIKFMQALERSQFQLANDLTVDALLTQHAQPESLCESLWRPLCLAALNTPSQIASAQVFCTVLQDSLAGPREASDFLFPRVDLSELFPAPAMRWLLQQPLGHSVHLSHAATRIEPLAQTIRVHFHASENADQSLTQDFDQVVIATAPHHTAALVPDESRFAPLHATLNNFEYLPIATAWFGFANDVRLPHALLGRIGKASQWIMDRGQIRAHQAGVVSVILSAPNPTQLADRDALMATLLNELREICPSLPNPHWQKLIVEQRATFACTPNLQRPSSATEDAKLWLTGDYVLAPNTRAYPATIEGAVRQGQATAAQILQRVAAPT